jgi:hypothetical protein
VREPSERRVCLQFIFVMIACFLTACGGGGHGGTVASTQFLPDCVDNGKGIAVLSWDPPTTDKDGQPIGLAGFRIFCKTAGGYLQWVGAAGPTDTTLVLTDLVFGTLTFAVTAISTDGVESEYSNFQNKLIQ